MGLRIRAKRINDAIIIGTLFFIFIQSKCLRFDCIRKHFSLFEQHTNEKFSETSCELIEKLLCSDRRQHTYLLYN